jgi:hypothetical protein
LLLANGTGEEADFVIEAGGRLLPIEVKAALACGCGWKASGNIPRSGKKARPDRPRATQPHFRRSLPDAQAAARWRVVNPEDLNWLSGRRQQLPVTLQRVSNERSVCRVRPSAKQQRRHGPTISAWSSY